MQELRKLARWQINRQAKFKEDQSPGELLCQVQDINYKGVGVISEAKLPQDTAFRLYLKFSEDYSFDAEVWVVWNKMVNGINHYGLFFTRLRDVDKEKIYQFINANCPKEVVQKWWPGSVEAKSQWSNSYIQQRGNALPQLLCLVAVIGIIVSIIYWIFPWIVFVGGFVIVTISVVGLRVFHFCCGKINVSVYKNKMRSSVLF